MSELTVQWTGHPLVDVGIATLCAMVGKGDPHDLTLEDLDAVGHELRSAYSESIFVSYLSCVYTMNAPYTNPTMGNLARKKAIDRLLLPHRSEPDQGVAGHRCVFSGEPATHFIDRSQMPMLTGAGVLNFFPAGLSELTVAAPYLLAIQALAVGGRRSEGKLLLVHCDDPEFTLQFVRKFLARNRVIIDLSKANRLPAVDDPEGLLSRELPGGLSAQKTPKYPDAKAPESLVMADLIEIVSDRKSGALKKSFTSVTVYLLSNSGQGPSLEILWLPCEFVGFLFELESTEVRSKWKRLVNRTWRAGKLNIDSEDTPAQEKPASKKGKSPPKPVPSGAGYSRNEAFNDLFAIFAQGSLNWMAATRFIRRHLLSDAMKTFGDPGRLHRAPKFDYEQIDLIDWELTALFLRKVLGMNSDRIQLIKDFATSLADLIQEHDDRKLFRNLVFTEGEWQYRAILAKVQMQYAKDRGKLALGFDEFVSIFLTSEPGELHVWSLVRDLISIRLVERLFELKFFSKEENRQALESPEADAA